MRYVYLTILACALAVIFVPPVHNENGPRPSSMTFQPSVQDRSIKNASRFVRQRQFANSLQKKSGSTLQPQHMPIPLSARAELWAQNTLPAPRDKAQSVFRAIVALVYDSHEDDDEIETRALAVQFLGENETLDAYIKDVLEVLPQHTYQRERNFIYSFARTARPNTSFSEYVVKDLDVAFKSNLNLRLNDLRQMSDALMRQPDLTLAEKREILARHDLR